MPHPYRGLADESVGWVNDTLLRNDTALVDEFGSVPVDDTGAQLIFRFAAAYERRSPGIASRWSFRLRERNYPPGPVASGGPGIGDVSPAARRLVGMGSVRVCRSPWDILCWRLEAMAGRVAFLAWAAAPPQADRCSRLELLGPQRDESVVGLVLCNDLGQGRVADVEYRAQCPRRDGGGGLHHDLDGVFKTREG